MTPGADGHRYFEELAVSHVVGGLDESEGRVFRAHLLECNECRAQVGELRAIAHDLADIERDERRVRAAKAIETKRRETDDDEPDAGESPPVSRASRVALIVGLMLVIVLSAWNFTLRGSVEQLIEANRRSAEAAAVLGFGDEWDVVGSPPLRGVVRMSGSQLVVLLGNANPERMYAVSVYDERSQPLWSGTAPVLPNGSFLVIPGRDMTAAARVIVTDAGSGEPDESPSGPPLFEAEPPVASRR
ncbi:MAG: hypothetical protein ACRD0K_06470 [Egibacteraceae bacterium]